MRRLGRACLGALVAAAFLVGAGGVARAQMPDPLTMSGLPRPDPAVKEGTITVRVLRADFAHPMAGQDVSLDGPGGARTGKTDEVGRATFDGLQVGGTYVATAKSGDQSVGSQPMEMGGGAGVRVMLVFKPDEKAMLAEKDGVARADKAVPVGAVYVTVTDGDDKPRIDLPVVLGHVAKDSGQQIEELLAKTDATGTAHFEGKPGAADAYIVAVKQVGLVGASKPFRIEEGAGMRINLRALAGTRNTKVLSIGTGAHFILEVKDDSVEVRENITISNQATDPFETGPAGLEFLLPPGAEGAQAAGEPNNLLTVDDKRALIKGTLPPGDTNFSFGFVLPQKGAVVELRQTLPIAMERFTTVTDRFEGMRIEGDEINTTERELGGRRFWVLSGKPVRAGGEMWLRLANLPHRSTATRNIGVTLAGFLALLAIFAFVRAEPEEIIDRVKLEGERDRLLDELSDLDGDAKGKSAKAKDIRSHRRDEVLARLEKIYRQLEDDLASGVHGAE